MDPLSLANPAGHGDQVVPDVDAALERRRLLTEMLLGWGASGAPAATDDVDPMGQVPVTSAQASVWISHRLAPGDPSYNLSCEVPLAGAVPDAVRGALAGLVGRHGALRTLFLAAPDASRGVAQHVLASATPEMVIIDLRVAADRMQSAPDIDRSKQAIVDMPFDLRRAPLLRAALFLRPDGHDELLLVVHHIVSDGESLVIMARDFQELYRAELEGGRPELPAPASFVAAVRREVGVIDEPGDQLRDWWHGYLNACPTRLELPVDHSRPATASGAGLWVPMGLDAQRGAALQAWSRERGVSSFAVVLACYAATLARYAGVDDVLIGVPVSARGQSGIQDVVGMFVHTLPVRISGFAQPAVEVIHGVQTSLAMVMDHHSYPIEALVADLGDRHRTGSHPLFQATATHQAYRRVRTDPAGQRGTIRFDISLRLDESEGGLGGALGGRVELFEPETLMAIRDRIESALDLVLADPQAHLTRAPWGSAAAPRDPPGGAVMPIPSADWRPGLAAALAAGRLTFDGNPVTVGEQEGSGSSPLVVAALDGPEQLAAALAALLGARSLVLIDPLWPQAWRERCLGDVSGSQHSDGSILLVSDIGPDGQPRLTEITADAVAHAVAAAASVVSGVEGQLLAVAGLAPAVALLHAVIPGLCAGLRVVVVPGEVSRVLDLAAWEDPQIAVVDARRAHALRGEGWDAQLRVVTTGDATAVGGLAGPAGLGFAAALVGNDGLTLVPPVRLVDAPAPGAVGHLALGPHVSDTQARLLRGGGLQLVPPLHPPALAPADLVDLVARVPGVDTCELALGADEVVVHWTGDTRDLEVPGWVSSCLVGTQRWRWRAVRRLPAGVGAGIGPDPELGGLAEVVRRASEHVLDVAVTDLDASFYALGGQSLALVQLASELSDLLGVEVSLTDLFSHPSVRELTGHLAAGADGELDERAARVLATLDLEDAEVHQRLLVMAR